MMNPKTQTIVATTIIALTSSIGITLIPTKPDASTAVLITLAVFVIVWNGTRALIKRKNPELDWLTSKARHEILFAIILASLLLLGAMIMTVAKQLELLDGDVIKRIVGINTGLMLIVLGNYMPKKNQATTGECGCPSKSSSSSIQRFLGWTFVLGGLLYTLAWITLDLDQAGIAIMFSFPAAIAIIFALRFAYLRFAPTKNLPSQSA